MTWVEIGSTLSPIFFRHISLDARIDLGERADRAGNRAGRYFAARSRKALLGAGEFGIGISELQPKRRRLGMNAVRAADGRREFVFAARGV